MALGKCSLIISLVASGRAVRNTFIESCHVPDIAVVHNQWTADKAQTLALEEEAPVDHRDVAADHKLAAVAVVVVG